MKAACEFGALDLEVVMADGTDIQIQRVLAYLAFERELTERLRDQEKQRQRSLHPPPLDESSDWITQ